MKFAYVDESGDKTQSDVFVMAGCLVDAYRLRRITADFDASLKELFARHPGHPAELKTKNFINGQGGWNVVPPDERKAFLRSICTLASHDSRLFCSALSFKRFGNGVEGQQNHPTRGSYWHAASMFVTSLIQKKVQKVPKNKGLTVLVMDDNKMTMPALSDAIYAPVAWFDGLYQVRPKRQGKWRPRRGGDRFDHIINTAFAIKSDHSSLVQVADAISFVYRRHLELGRGSLPRRNRILYRACRDLRERSREARPLSGL
jgi:Protein of unknown function (DUF3800)